MASVASKLWSLLPIVAAAIIWTAHPQSIEAIAATLPIVFASKKGKREVVSRIWGKLVISKMFHAECQ